MTFRYDTRLRRAALLAVAFVAFGLLSCGKEPRACNDCPPLAGGWTLIFDDPALLSAPCEAMGVAHVADALALTVTQVGSGLQGTLEGVELRGTAWDTWDFNLNGTIDQESLLLTLAVSGRYGPGAGDGGGRLSGAYTASHARGDRSCVFSRRFTAVRTP